MTTRYVSLNPAPGAPGPVATAAMGFGGATVDGALEFATQFGLIAPTPGDGSTRDLWEALATLASHDLGVARAVEPHLDAVAIVRQAGLDDLAHGATWGVFAAEGGNDPLTASPVDGGWSLTGTKPWCSLADRLDRALVTARIGDGERGLFAVDLQADGVTPQAGAWHARGLSEIPSGPVVFRNVAATTVGEPGWYLSRPGFAWGGIGVAACWFGGAVGLGRSLFAHLAESPDPIAAMHLGAVDEQLQSARRALAEAATLVDEAPDDVDGSVLAKRVRSTVAAACESVLAHVAHALGPAPLALDDEHAKRVADLELYVRQHHAEKDLASLGSALARSGKAPW